MISSREMATSIANANQGWLLATRSDLGERLRRCRSSELRNLIKRLVRLINAELKVREDLALLEWRRNHPVPTS